jgi:hypothetical protein
LASLNGFSVKVPECLSETSENYVVMRHGQQYSLKLSNHHKKDGRGKPCDVEIYIDNEFCGSYRIESGQGITLERPEYSNQRFTAYKIGSEEAEIAKIDNNKSMGLIRAIFRPGNCKIHYHTISAPSVNPWPYVPKSPEEPWIKPGVYTYAVSDWDTITPTYRDNSHGNYYSYGPHGDVSTSVVASNVDSGSSSYTSRDLIGGGTGLSGESNQKFNEVDSLDYDEPAVSIYLRLAFGKDEPEIRPLKRVYSTVIPNPL